MKLIVGLGNPGQQYESTRHNIGFMVLDRLLEETALGGVPLWKQKGKGELASTIVGSESLYLLKPTTFMNLSGEAVQEVARFYKIDAHEVLVVHDEIDLPFGCIRLKKGGGDGGHNGIKSVASQLGSRDFTRLRLGVGRPDDEKQKNRSVSNWVLSPFDAAERDDLPLFIRRSIEAIETLQREGLKTAQNKFH